jgi:phage terminase large subunit-like protein
MKNKRKQITKTILLIIGIAIIPLLKLHAEDLRSVVRFSSYWKFSIGDRPEWSSANTTTAIGMKSVLEGRGKGKAMTGTMATHGIGSKFKLSSYYDSQMYLVISNIDDCDEVFINGDW